jgi:hypothetical protein
VIDPVEQAICWTHRGFSNPSVVAGHFAKRHFAKRHFAERHFAERTFYRTDSLPNGQFAENRDNLLNFIGSLKVIVDFDDRNYDS